MVMLASYLIVLAVILVPVIALGVVLGQSHPLYGWGYAALLTLLCMFIIRHVLRKHRQRTALIAKLNTTHGLALPTDLALTGRLGELVFDIQNRKVAYIPRS